jgi:hypothetical protein
MVDTPYAMWSCDDDLPIPETLELCAAMLKADSSLGSVIGDLVRVDLHGGANLVDCNHIPYRSRVDIQATNAISNSSAADRFLEFNTWFYASLFSVMRSEIIKQAVPAVGYTITYPMFAAEFLWHYTVPILAKTAVIDGLHLIRVRHAKAYGSLHNKGEVILYPDYVEAMLSPQWHHDANAFVDYVAGLIAQVDDSSVDAARRVSIKGFAEMSARRLLWTHQKEFHRTLRGRKRRWLYNNRWTRERRRLEMAIAALLSTDV